VFLKGLKKKEIFYSFGKEILKSFETKDFSVI